MIFRYDFVAPLNFLMLFGKYLQQAVQNLATNQNLYLIIFRTRNFLCVNCLFLRWFVLQYLEAGEIFQDSGSFAFLFKNQIMRFLPKSSKNLIRSLIYLQPKKVYYHLIICMSSDVDCIQYHRSIDEKCLGVLHRKYFPWN